MLLSFTTRAGSPQQYTAYQSLCTYIFVYLAYPQQGYHNSVSQLLLPILPIPPCQLSLWEETRVPGENPQLSAER